MGKRKKINFFNPKNIYNDFNETALMNNSTYLDYFYRMREIWLNLYKWENVPEEIDVRFLELQLFERGNIAFFNDEDLGYIVLPFSQVGNPDIYNNPIKIRAYSNIGYNITLNKNDFVIIYNNYSRITPKMTIENFAYRLYETQRSIDVNIKNQKNTKLCAVPESQRLTFENIFKNIYGNVPVIYVDSTIDTDCVKEIDLSATYTADKMDIHKNMVWNEFLTWCGIENSNQDKKERLVENEVGSNYGNVEISRNTCLQSRLKAVEKINKKFGLDIKVSFNSELITLLNNPTVFYDINKGGDENE